MSFDWDPRFTEKWKEFEGEVGPVLADELATQAPVDTGQLANSQDWRDEDDQLQVYSEDNRGPIALFVIRGTAPHPIDPVRARSLHWVDRNSGEDVFAGHVDHPGTMANPFNLVGWEAQQDYVVSRFARIVGVGYALAFLNPWKNKTL